MKSVKPVIIIAIAVVFGTGIGLLLDVSAEESLIPSWIKNNAGWWADGLIDDFSFVQGIEYMINNEIIQLDQSNMVTSSTIEDRGDFYLTYEPTTYYQEYEDWLKVEQYFEIQIPFLNDQFKLPYDINIVVAECGEANAFYYEQEITMCYEFIEETDFKFKNYFDSVYGDDWTIEDLNFSVINVIEHTLYHEMGHALIETYELPTTGMEEDVADQFGAYILLEFPYDDDPANSIGGAAMIDTAIDFELAAQDYDLEITDFADEHALDQQRFFNLACWTYGSNPDNNQYMLEENWIPEYRLVQCEYEYDHLVYAWDTLLEPFFKLG